MEIETTWRAAWGYVAAFPAELVPYAVVAAYVGAALLAHAVLARLAKRFLLAPDGFTSYAIRRTAAPTRLAALAAGLAIGLSAVDLPGTVDADLRRLVLVLLIVLIGWIGIVVTGLAADLARRRLDVDVEDNLRARRSLTQISILTRTVQVVIVIVAASAVLVTFESVRQWGVSLLASAGVAGLVIGLAARPVFANLMAGVQIALTQPIRIDDVVIVEDEWGWIEEIGSAFVVVRLWDWRRLVVPLAYFIEQPFQNWTRESASIIGAVTWHVDYRAPVEAMRAKLTEFLEASPRWDRRVANLQVTEAFESTIVVRALMSARNSPTAWDLRCDVREQMIAWLNAEHPDSLPRQRGELERWPAPCAPVGRDDATVGAGES
jgi:small-conductance mechanosensitive channel